MTHQLLFSSYFKRLYGILFFVLIATYSFAQIGGKKSYQFVLVSNSARQTALGNSFITCSDDDLAASLLNPACLNSVGKQSLAIGNNFYLSDINKSQIAYSSKLNDERWSYAVDFIYMNYGDFKYGDVNGFEGGTFSVSDAALTGSVSRALFERLSVGMSARYMWSAYETYRGSAISFDMGLVYQSRDSSSHIGLVFKNVGFEVAKFNDNRSKVDPALNLALSHRLRHLPFRFTIMVHHLDQWNLTYDDPDQGEEDGVFQPLRDNSGSFIDNLFRHLNFGGEFYLGKKAPFHLRFGYSYLINQSLGLENYSTLGGFSFGFGLRIRKFKLDYGMQKFHISQFAHHLTLAYRFGVLSSTSLLD